MCGIIGYVGGRASVPILLNGLKHLEYRGYDSAGIAVLTPAGDIRLHKVGGRIEKLVQSLEGNSPEGSIGIGHTRWATHGAPVTRNAHPHTDCSERLVVVHNGIIENYADLRRELISRGHSFRSETDTEVIAHLVEEEYKGAVGEGRSRKATAPSGGPDGNLLVTAVRRALGRMRGSYAIAILSRDEPELLIGARLHAPLIVGLGEGENFLASDIPAILGETRRVVPMEDGEVVALTLQEAHIYTLDGKEVSRQPFTVTWDAEAAEKGGYPHFVLKEIYEQPEGLRNALRGRIRAGTIHLPELEGLDLSQVERVYMVACGTAYHAGLLGKRYIEGWAKLPVEAAIGSEFRYGHPVLDERTLCILVSQSGETADTLAPFYLAKEAGAKTLSITNTVASSITRGADAVLYMQVGPEIGVVATKTFTAQIAVLCLVGLHLGRKRGALDEGTVAKVAAGLTELPARVEEILNQGDEIGKLATEYAYRRSCFFLGRGWGYPIALEGALKLKEISYIHAEGYPAGEMKHGPIAVLDPEIPVVAIATQDPLYEKMLSNIQEVRARQTHVLALATEGDQEILDHVNRVLYIPCTLPELAPVVATIPLQLFAYHIAVELGRDVDKPRNLAKSVTVE